jgi:surface protein
MHSTFYNAYALKNQDLSSWNVDNVSTNAYFLEWTAGGNTKPKWK